MDENTQETSSIPVMPSTRQDKRILFEHTVGPYPGLLQIMGMVSELGATDNEPLPDHAEGFEALGRLIDFASLIKVTRTYAFYRELNPDNMPSKTFDKDQQ